MESLMTTMRGRVLNGELMVGTFGGLSPSALEVMANAGFDFVCLDAEHSPHDRAVLEHPANKLPFFFAERTIHSWHLSDKHC